MSNPFQEAMREIEDDIKLMSAASLLKVEGKLPKTFSIKGNSAYQSEAWKIGYGRCLAEVRRIIREVTDNEAK